MKNFKSMKADTPKAAARLKRYSGEMRTLLIINAVLMCPVLCLADSEPVSPGDWLFIQARVIGCGESIRDVEVGKAGDSGEVTFFEEISIQAEGKSTAEIGQLVADEVEKASGQRPTTIKIVRIPKTDPKSATWKMLEMWHHGKGRCPAPVRQKRLPDHEIPEWLYDLHLIALSSQNKSPEPPRWPA